MAPLRQLKGVPAEVFRKATGKQFVSDICPPIDWLLTLPVFHSLGVLTERFVNLAFSRVAQSYLDPSWSW